MRGPETRSETARGNGRFVHVWGFLSGLLFSLGILVLLQAYGLMQLTWVTVLITVGAGAAISLLNVGLARAIRRGRERRAARSAGVRSA